MLTNSQMGVYAGITSRARQILILTVWDMEVGFWITVLLCKTKVNDVDLISTLSDPHQEVVGLNVAVNEGLGVDVFNTRDELICKEQDGLQRELSIAEVEKILQAGSKKV